jgi:hypothetical protein
LHDGLLETVIGSVDLALQRKVVQHLVVQQIFKIGQSATGEECNRGDLWVARRNDRSRESAFTVARQRDLSRIYIRTAAQVSDWPGSCSAVPSLAAKIASSNPSYP